AEQRVALLVGAGLTNPQIAARLFVSPDTVKGHVSAALRKLGVSNRAALAAEATRRGRVRPRPDALRSALPRSTHRRRHVQEFGGDLLPGPGVDDPDPELVVDQLQVGAD